ncbi:type 2 periplasmic-binding domain-containing protein [Paraburkholderia elongata]|uniref:Uncharacterized protein n=1 Tax=Paraburkholderia elongata TaxID=2675747 RepID=A0A972NUD6_9BURK|nr:hypothetical protein [Paraburkholderia elongata]NPT58564.1 hypothetical protein [Paraburkholderia elongata]
MPGRFFEEMESNLQETTLDPQDTLRIATPMTFATVGLGALLPAYRTLHSRADFDVTTFDTHIDLVEEPLRKRRPVQRPHQQRISRLADRRVQR